MFGRNKVPYAGGQILNQATLDGSTTATTVAFTVAAASDWALQCEWTDDASSLAITVTLWASCKANPNTDLTDDTDWVQMTSSHGWGGLPGGNPAGGSGKDLTDVGVSGALWYKVRFARTAGSGKMSAWTVQKMKK